MEETKKTTCPHCGAELPADAAFCPNCAAELKGRETVLPPKKRHWRRALPICLAAVVVLAIAAVFAVPKLMTAWAESHTAPLITDAHWTEDGDFGFTLPRGAKAYGWVGVNFHFENKGRMERGEDNQFGNSYSCYRVDESNISNLYKSWENFKEQGGSDSEYRFRVRVLTDPYEVVNDDDSIWSEWSEWRTFD